MRDLRRNNCGGYGDGYGDGYGYGDGDSNTDLDAWRFDARSATE